MIKNEYRIDTLFNGVVKVFFVTKKKLGRWPFTYWACVHTEKIFEGTCQEKARQSIEQHVIDTRDDELKYREWKNDRGETRPEDYPCW